MQDGWRSALSSTCPDCKLECPAATNETADTPQTSSALSEWATSYDLRLLHNADAIVQHAAASVVWHVVPQSVLPAVRR